MHPMSQICRFRMTDAGNGPGPVGRPVVLELLMELAGRLYYLNKEKAARFRPAPTRGRPAANWTQRQLSNRKLADRVADHSRADGDAVINARRWG